MKTLNLLPKKKQIYKEIPRDKNKFLLQLAVNPHLAEYCLIFIVFSQRLLSSLIFRCSMKVFHKDMMQLSEIFEKNGYDKKILTGYSESF